MKKHIVIRILAALGGLTLWAIAAGMLAETFFHLPITARIGQVLGASTPVSVLVTLLAVIALAAFGLCCLLMLSGKRATRRKGFVMQRGENGVIGVSIKSIESLVDTCVKQHDVIASAQISVVERRDGIVILLDIEEAAGLNIPLAIGTLQKQIKQYVSTCTGVDVREVRVMVENTGENAGESPFLVEKPVVMNAAAVVVAAEKQHEAIAAPAQEPAVEAEDALAETVMEDAAAEEPSAQEEAPAVEMAAPVAAPVMPPLPDMPELAVEDDRPLHQRLFGAEEQPVFVPAPPVMAAVPVEEPVEEIPAEDAPAEEAAEEIQLESEDEGIDADAVLEVVEAISYEEPQMDGETEIQPEEDDFAAEVTAVAEEVQEESAEEMPADEFALEAEEEEKDPIGE